MNYTFADLVRVPERDGGPESIRAYHWPKLVRAYAQGTTVCFLPADSAKDAVETADAFNVGGFRAKPVAPSERISNWAVMVDLLESCE